jgi:16S rRNA (uracil1498-N3)-methyltransferase
MTHRFWVAGEQLSGERVRFSPEQAHQMRNVLRLRTGQHVRVFDGVEMADHVVELTEAATGRVVGNVAQAPEPRTRVSVYLALLQRDKFEVVLQKLTEIGAGSITPVITARSLVREVPDARRYARWLAILREAAEQCGRGVVPELLPAEPLSIALQRGEGRVLMAFEGERQHELRDALRGRPPVVSVFVGPEGGYTSDEVDCARRLGAEIVALGPRVLRTETASPLLAALVLYELGDLSWPEDLSK